MLVLIDRVLGPVADPTMFVPGESVAEPPVQHVDTLGQLFKGLSAHPACRTGCVRIVRFLHQRQYFLLGKCCLCVRHDKSPKLSTRCGMLHRIYIAEILSEGEVGRHVSNIIIVSIVN